MTFDCVDPQRVARFWSALLGREPGPSEDGWVYLGHRGDAQLARSRIAVCPTIGVDAQLMTAPPPAIKAMMARMGMTAEHMLQARWDFVGRLHRAGVRLVSGVDSGIGPAKRHGVLPHAVGELVTAGLSVTEALATATLGAAQACGVSARKGRLAVAATPTFSVSMIICLDMARQIGCLS